jgi:hypothetical protein
MGTDLLEIRPALGPFKLNFNELYRRLRSRRQSDGVAERIVWLFGQHGIAPTQIQRFVPAVGLDKLEPEKMETVLNDCILQQITDLFGVNREWIEGTQREIYPYRSCYKQLTSLLEVLPHSEGLLAHFPVRVLFEGSDLDRSSSKSQFLALVVCEPIGSIGEKQVFRYQVFRDEWDWTHRGCRLQLKAMARWLDQVRKIPTPLFRTTRKNIDRILQGRHIPRLELDRCCITEPSLEDFALARSESVQARDVDELDDVIAYLKLAGAE